MSQNKTTAADMFAHFKGASQAAISVYNRTLANRNSAAPSIFEERKPAVVATVDRQSSPQFNHSDPPHHLASQFKGFTSATQARDALYSFRAGLGRRHNDRHARAEIACKGSRDYPDGDWQHAGPAVGRESHR